MDAQHVDKQDSPSNNKLHRHSSIGDNHGSKKRCNIHKANIQQGTIVIYKETPEVVTDEIASKKIIKGPQQTTVL